MGKPLARSRRARSGRSSVTVKKKRRAETALLIATDRMLHHPIAPVEVLAALPCAGGAAMMVFVARSADRRRDRQMAHDYPDQRFCLLPQSSRAN